MSSPMSRGSGAAAAPPAAALSVADPFFHRVLTPAQQSYVREFTSWSVSRLEREPRALAAHTAQLQSALEDLSLSNYPTFLRTHAVMTDAHTKLHAIDTHMAKLGTVVLPELMQACASFSAAAPVILSAQSSARLLEKEQSFLLELLEIPQLMDTCFKNQMIHEALQLDLYVKELSEKMEAAIREQQTATADSSTPTPVPVVLPSILTALKVEIHSIKANIVRSLLSQLRGNITVETGFPIVGLLKRTLDVFGSAGAEGGPHDRSILLKYQFIMARNAYFEGAIKALQAPAIPADTTPGPAASTPAAASSAASSSASTLNAALFKYLDELLYLNRTNLFDIITLYSALFLDHDDLSSSESGPASGAEAQANEDLGLLARWIHYRVELMIDTLQHYLPHISDGSSLLALLNSCMEYGARLSRSKVGLDFRPLLPPLFCRVILARFAATVDRAASTEFESHMKSYALRIDATQLRKMGITALQQSADNKDHLQSFIHAFLPHPPLAMLADCLIAATNCLSKCAPLELAPDIGAAMHKALATAVHKIKSLQTTGPGAANHADASNGVSKSTTHSGAFPAGTSAADLLELARVFRDSFVPFAHALLLRVYPHAQALLSVASMQSSLSALFEEEERDRARIAAETRAREQAEAQRKLADDRRAQQQQDQREAEILSAARAVLDAPVASAAAAAAADASATASAVDLSPEEADAAAASPAATAAAASPAAASAVPASALPPPRSQPLPLSAAHPFADDDNDPFAVAAAKISQQTRNAAARTEPAAALPSAAPLANPAPPTSLADADAAPAAPTDEQSVDDMLASW